MVKLIQEKNTKNMTPRIISKACIEENSEWHCNATRQTMKWKCNAQGRELSVGFYIEISQSKYDSGRARRAG